MSELELDVIYNEDCLEGMKRLPSKSVNLIIADPPYNIKKAEWDKIENYFEWCGLWLKECERVLADNGSFYMFHNYMPSVSQLMVQIEKETGFVLKQFIVWNKKFHGAKHIQVHALQYNDSLRSYAQMAEYILFYTFQDETGLTTVYDNKDCFLSIKKYLRKERYKTQQAGYSDRDLRKLCGVSLKGGGLLGHYWGNAQWLIPIEKHYKKLQSTGFFQRSYESLRQEYESLRYTFNNQKSYHSVWNYDIAERNGHPTPKPIPLIENILRHSSNKEDIVLVPFVGSGNECIACQNLNRHYVGFETNKDYCAIAEKRLAQGQLELK